MSRIQPKASLSKIKNLDDTIDDDLEGMWEVDEVPKTSKLQAKINRKTERKQQKQDQMSSVRNITGLNKAEVGIAPVQQKAAQKSIVAQQKKPVSKPNNNKQNKKNIVEEVHKDVDVEPEYNEEIDDEIDEENNEETGEWNEEDGDLLDDENDDVNAEEEDIDADLEEGDEDELGADDDEEDLYGELNEEDLLEMEQEDDEMDEETKQKIKEKNIQKAIEFREQQARKGVVYLSRIPPYMKVSQLRKLFSPYNVERIYLTPEDEGKRKFRVKQGGNKRRSYTEGWMEFKDKKYAKYVARVFNNQKIGGKRRSFYSEDVLNLKYLPKFKWENLTERISYDMKMRKERLRTELSQEKKAHDFYRDQVETSKMIMGIKKHKDLKRAALEDIDLVMNDGVKKGKDKQDGTMKLSHSDEKDKIRRAFPQKKPKL